MSLYLCQKCGSWQENIIHGNCHAGLLRGEASDPMPTAVIGDIPSAESETGWVQLKVVYSKSGGMIRKKTFIDGKLVSFDEFPGMLDASGVPWDGKAGETPEGFERTRAGRMVKRPRARRLKEFEESIEDHMRRLEVRPLLLVNTPLTHRRIRK
jgi:hypothetical protein